MNIDSNHVQRNWIFCNVRKLRFLGVVVSFKVLVYEEKIFPLESHAEPEIALMSSRRNKYLFPAQLMNYNCKL